MSARREKRLRKLERSVESMSSRLEELEKQETARAIQRANEEYWRDVRATYQTVINAAPPHRSLWRRLLDAVRGRDDL